MSWPTVDIPLAAGLNTKADPRALQPPQLSVCQNAEFDEAGGLQKRKPYASLSTNILGGGTLSDIRRTVAHEDELLCFTKDKLYTWSARDSAWVLKATYVAPKTTERSVFNDPFEQSWADRAELSNTVLFTWTDAAAEGLGQQAYIAALDATTGAVLLAPTGLGSDTLKSRLVVGTSRVLLFYVHGGTSALRAIALDPANLASSLASGLAAPVNIASAAFALEYDACPNQSGGAIVGMMVSPGGYEIATVNSALAFTRVAKARVADGAISVTTFAAVNGLLVIRADGTNIRGDCLVLATLADTGTVNVLVGTAATTPVNSIAVVAHNTVGAGEVRAFWTSGQTTSTTSYRTETNTFSLALGAVGTQAVLARRLAIASRAFSYDSNPYVWLLFAGDSYASGASTPTFRTALQNTYFLFRGDGTTVAKATGAVAGKLPTAGCLPEVQSLGSNRYAWCGLVRRRIPSNVGGKTDTYADQGPREIVVEFDSNEARRTARLGRTLYVTGGQVLQYDGQGLWEVGFHLFPFAMAVSSTTTPGNIDVGTHAYRRTRRWANAYGEVEESTTATVISHTNAGPAQKKSFSTLDTLWASRKASTIEDIVWRTLKDPLPDSPFYRTNSSDPSTYVGDNRYVKNDLTVSSMAYDDNLSDADLSVRETSYENGGILENLAPPAATVISASHDRLFLAGVAGRPHTVWYSKLRSDGEIAAFHDALSFELPPGGGAITALAFLNETLVVFKETAVYLVPGEGFTNSGDGQNYGPARVLASDIGAQRAEAVALSPLGLVFRSDKGFYRVTPQFTVEYIGAAGFAFDSDTVTAIHVLESKHQIRCVSASRVLVWDYLVNQWSEWTITGAVHAALWAGAYLYATSTAVRQEQTAYGTERYSLDIETPWLKLGGPSGWARVRRLFVLAEYRSAHRLRIRIARRYLESDASGVTWASDRLWTVSPTVVGGPERVKHRLPWTKVDVVKVRITDRDSSIDDAPLGEGVRLTALSFEVKPKDGLHKQLPAAQNL